MPVRKSKKMQAAEERIGEKLEDFLVREYPNMTHKELSKRLKVAEATVGRWIYELGFHPEKRLLRPDEFLHIAKRFTYQDGRTFVEGVEYHGLEIRDG